MKLTLAKGKAYLRERHPPLANIVDGLAIRGLSLVRFEQSRGDEGSTCGTLKFAGLPDEYILAFRLVRPEEAYGLLARCDGQGGITPIQLDELSADGVARAIWNDATSRSAP